VEGTTSGNTSSYPASSNLGRVAPMAATPKSEILSYPHHIWHEADVDEARCLEGGLPVLGRENSSVRTVERVESRRLEYLRQLEDELRIGRLPHAQALRHTSRPPGASVWSTSPSVKPRS
jgi:hypothetical protein